ncbi:uncharacterized protein LACBIDRAFT_333103 [Laccaria bicolor S238N-H82]|uniref:Predicted protein n=1 Tax=Laccaria bicolor (strain S238N-H82 / ATCC MYA-4686) TaxID=486041 RepID=B0DUW0_LACBS|nr:uncharacterized protein LACBIDRAFT_333103 [Laccaria bicolor S238N-H82]EDR01680.1 predicted protein [Laccaria bicolor S238N-H82]|eukprot:XP_001887756.1 predicted protein [Laccaria bicolor S238N-H82]
MFNTLSLEVSLMSQTSKVTLNAPAAHIGFLPFFPGVGVGLTDPQILTAPQFGNDLFGDGNLGEAFNLFPLQHQCNKYCEWFELQNPSEIAQMGDQLATGNKKSLGKSKGKVSILGTQYNSD